MEIHIVESMDFNEVQKARLKKLNVKIFEGMPDLNELLKRIEGADVIAVDFSPIAAAIPLLKPGQLKLVAMPLSGVSWLPLQEAAKKGIKFCNTPDYGTEGVAEFGFALMLSIVKKIGAYITGEPKLEIVPALYGYGTICNYVIIKNWILNYTVSLRYRHTMILYTTQK